MSRRVSCAAAALVALAGVRAAALPRQSANPDARALADFTARLRQYTELRTHEEAKLPRLERGSEAAKLVAHQEALARRIRAGRSGARQGEIFTAAVSSLLRRALARVLQGPEGVKVRTAIFEDSPANLSLGVNESYPASAPLGTVPPSLLGALPRLPDDLEYRFIGRTLILRDARANLIIDLLPNAFR